MGDRLLEREDQLGQLTAAWDAVRRTGRGDVVLVRGEAGSGKTALLEAFSAGLTGQVWSGRCHPLSTPRPLGPFAEVADQLGGELAEVVRREGRPHEVAAALSRWAPADGPAVVVLEDLHWADEASLDVLRMLARPLRERALLVLASYRDDEVERGSTLQAALGDLCSAQTTRVELRPLSVAAVKALSRGTRHDPDTLHRRSGGNAFYVTESLASDQAVSATIVDAALGRLARLSPGARAVTEAVSVVPQVAELWLVEALAGLEHLDEAVGAGVLIARPEGVAFRHELTRLAVEGTLPPYRRMVLNRAALATLSARAEGEPARLVHHALAAQDSDAVLVHARAAAERAGRLGAKREAAAHWEQALLHAPTDAEALRADLLEELSFARFLIDHMAESIEDLQQALEIRCRSGDPLGEGRVLNALVRRLGCAGREAELPAVLARAEEVLERIPPSAELARVYALHAYDAMERGNPEATQHWGWRAIELAEELEAVDVQVHALNTLGVADLLSGGDGEQLLRSMRIAEEHDLDEAVGRGWLNGASCYASQHRVDRLDWVDQGVTDCDRRGLELWRQYVVSSRSDLQLALGRWDEAADGVAELLALRSADKLLRVQALCTTATVRLRRGDPGGREALAEAQAAVQGHQGLAWRLPVLLVAAEAAWLDGCSAAEMQALTDRTLASCRASAPYGTDLLLRWRRLAGVPAEPTSGRTPFSAPNVAHWRERGCGFDAAFGLLEEGAALEALALLQMIGALGTAGRVARDLRAAGVRELPRGPRTSTRANPAQLTDRELDVVRLVAEGLPNSAIADRLVLSTKTVDKHVSAALRKLGVASRRDAAARADELGRTAVVTAAE